MSPITPALVLVDARHSYVDRLAARRRQPRACSPTLRSCSSAKSWSTATPGRRRGRERGVRSRASTSASGRRVTVAGIDAGDGWVAGLADHSAGGEAHRRDGASTPSTCSIALGDAGRERREAVLVGDDAAALTCSSIALVDRRAQAGGEDRHEARRARRRSSAPTAVTAVRCGWRRGVLAREPAGEALEALQRAADQRRSAGAPASARAARSRRSSARRRGRAAARWRWRRPGRRTGRRAAARRRARSTHAGDDDPAPAQRAPAPGVDASRIASTGSIRVARRAGHEARRPRVARMPTTRPTMIVRGSSTVPVRAAGRSRTASNSAASAGREREAARAMPISRGEDADHERLDEHRAQHLARARRRACAAARTRACAGRR